MPTIGIANPAGPVYLLGCAENPVTDSAAVRPTGIPVVHWRCATSPVNAAAGDIVDLPASAQPVSPVYLQTWESGDGSWVTKTNTTNIVRSASRDAGAPGTVAGSLSWQALADGATRVKSPKIDAQSSTTYLVTGYISNGAASARSCFFAVDTYAAGTVFLTTFPATGVSVASGTSFTKFTIAFTSDPTAVQMEIYAVVSNALASETFYVDNVRAIA